MRALVIAMILSGATSPALAQTMITSTINGVRTGWNSDSFAIMTIEPVVNPANCSIPDGYISEKSLPGYNTYYAAALTAMTAPSPTIVVTIHNSQCLSGRPVIIGVNLMR